MNNIELAKNVWENLKGSKAKAKKFEDLVAVTFSLLSEENEDMYVVVRDGQLMVEPYHYDDNNCKVEGSADIIAKMFSGELPFDKALSDGSVQVKSGDPAKLKALECLVPSKKPAAKSAKTAAAKSEDKKAAAKTEEKKPAEKKASAAAKTEDKASVKTNEKAAPAAKAEAAAKTTEKKAPEKKTTAAKKTKK